MAMNCPPDIAAAVLEILRTGVLRARAAGWSGDARRAAIEADHVHNLPDLLADFSHERLAYYWDVEAPSYRQQSVRAEAAQFQPLWDRLAAFVRQGAVV
jgi:hypothetical protein